MNPDDIRNLEALIRTRRSRMGPAPSRQDLLAEALMAYGTPRAASFTPPDRRQDLAEALLVGRSRPGLGRAVVSAAVDQGDSNSGPPAPTQSANADPGSSAPVPRTSAGAPPATAADDGPAAPSDGPRYKTIKAQSFDPSNSNGDTAVATPEMRAAAQAAADQYRVQKGIAEKAGFLAPDANGRQSYQGGGGSRAGSTSSADTLGVQVPDNASALLHGHIERSTDPESGGDDGMVDEPGANYGYGDTESLSREHVKRPIPTATEYNGQVGWHEIDNGQLQYTYPEGSMTPAQEQQMQKNLNREQKKFRRPK